MSKDERTAEPGRRLATPRALLLCRGAITTILAACLALVVGEWGLAAGFLVLAITLAGIVLRSMQRLWLRISSLVLVAFNVAAYARSRGELGRWAAHCEEKYGLGLTCMSAGDRLGYNVDYIFPWYLATMALTICWIAEHAWVLSRARQRAGLDLLN